jgi:hypothetical protein
MTQHIHPLLELPEPPRRGRSITPAAAPPPAAVGGVRTAAFVAGASLLLMAALAGFGNLVAVDGLVTPDDAAATARDIAASEGMFRFGVASLYVAALLDVVVAWALMRVFSPVNAELSRLDAWLRLAYSAVFMVALSQLVGIPGLLSGAGDPGGFTTDQVQVQALAKVESFQDIWFAGLVLFGAHLMVAGYLSYKSGYVPRLIGVLLVLAGAGYSFDSFVTVFTDDVPFTVSSATFLGEFLLGVWLLFRGRRITLTTPLTPATASER